MPVELRSLRLRLVKFVAVVAVLLVAPPACSGVAPVPDRDATSPAVAQPTASASSEEGADTAADNVLQGVPADGADAREWRASAADASPWVQLTWPEPQRITSVQIFGPGESASDPKQSSASALYGTLHFSEGEPIGVDGIDAGAGLPTTVAFPPRTTDTVRLELRRQIGTAVVGLRSLVPYAQGATPPRPSTPGAPTYSVTPPPATCDLSAQAGTAPTGRVALVCPDVGARVTDRADIVLSAVPGAVVTAALPDGSAQQRSTADGAGRASFALDLTDLSHGPFAVAVRAEGVAADEPPTYVQLFRASGATAAAGEGDSAPAGMTLQYDEQFDDPLSITADGRGAQYAAVKPEAWGGAQFGEAVFADPAWGAGTIATLPGGYLRLRAQPIGRFEEHQTWAQPHVAGLVSSQRVGGAGFSAQYGYFEARILGAPGPGAWPAFWMMNTAQGVGRPRSTVGEVDAVEMYGHDPRNTCHSTHAWGRAEGDSGKRACPNLTPGDDWVTRWHTFAVQVQPDAATFYIDGVQVATLPQLSNTDQPFFFMLDLATGGGWPVDLSATQETTDMYVDWVRVYT